MKANSYGVFKVIPSGVSVNLKIKSTHATHEEAEDSIKIPADMLGEVTYAILPLYTNAGLFVPLLFEPPKTKKGKKP